MQPASACSGRQRWLRWRRAFGLGLALALLQILLGVVFLFGQGTGLFVVFLVLLPLTPLCYLLFPGIEGFVIAQKNRDGCSGVDGGCFVGVVNLVALAIGSSALLVLAAPHFPGPNGSGNSMLVGVSLVLLLVQGLGSIVGGILGGWIGGVLGKGHTNRASQNSRTSAKGAPPGEVSESSRA